MTSQNVIKFINKILVKMKMIKKGDKKATRTLTFSSNNNLVKSKRSQVTVFVIIAIVIVVGIVLFKK